MTAEDWGLANGIHIPKGNDFKCLVECRLNVERKIFFGFLLKEWLISF